MAQHDMVLANAAGAAFRADANDALAALVTVNSGASAPSTTYAYMLWADTTNGLLKQRNAANSGWIVRGTLAEAFVVTKSSTFNIGVGDYAKVFDCTGTYSITFTAAATLGDGFKVRVRNAGSGALTLDPNSTEQINGATTLVLAAGQVADIYCSGAAFRADILSTSQAGVFNALTVNAATGGTAVAVFNNGADPNFLEFSKTGYTDKVAIGAQGNMEANVSYNMDYSTAVHRLYDTSKAATWLTINENGTYLQYAPATGGAGDVWTAGGSLYNLQILNNGNVTLRGDLVAPGAVTLNCSSAISTERVSAQGTVSQDVSVFRAESLHTSYTADCIVAKVRTAAGTGYNLFVGANSGGVAVVVAGNGNITNSNNSYGAISAAKAKDDIADVDAARIAAKFDRYHFVNYTLKADPEKKKLLGAVADEVKEISPGLVEARPDYEEFEDEREAEPAKIDTGMLDERGAKIFRLEPRTEKFINRRATGTFTDTVKYSVMNVEAMVALQETRRELAALKAAFEAYVKAHP